MMTSGMMLFRNILNRDVIDMYDYIFILLYLVKKKIIRN